MLHYRCTTYQSSSTNEHTQGVYTFVSNSYEVEHRTNERHSSELNDLDSACAAGQTFVKCGWFSGKFNLVHACVSYVLIMTSDKSVPPQHYVNPGDAKAYFGTAG